MRRTPSAEYAARERASRLAASVPGGRSKSSPAHPGRLVAVLREPSSVGWRELGAASSVYPPYSRTFRRLAGLQRRFHAATDHARRATSRAAGQSAKMAGARPPQVPAVRPIRPLPRTGKNALNEPAARCRTAPQEPAPCASSDRRPSRVHGRPLLQYRRQRRAACHLVVRFESFVLMPCHRNHIVQRRQQRSVHLDFPQTPWS